MPWEYDPNSIDHCKHPELRDVHYNVEVVPYGPFVLDGVGGWSSTARCTRCNARVVLVVPKEGGKLLVWTRMPPVEERLDIRVVPTENEPGVTDIRIRRKPPA